MVGAEQRVKETGEEAVRRGGLGVGVGGTRNCDWWFTDEAVMIDTAGRYTLQESDSAVDASAWDTFLSLLKKTRPRRPLNGVLLTVNVQDLLQQSPADRKEHAAKLRARIQELHTKLGIRPPVYVLLTKTDLPVAAIGRRVGWPDPSYASRRFAQVYAMSPTAYRAAHSDPP